MIHTFAVCEVVEMQRRLHDIVQANLHDRLFMAASCTIR